MHHPRNYPNMVACVVCYPCHPRNNTYEHNFAQRSCDLWVPTLPTSHFRLQWISRMITVRIHWKRDCRATSHGSYQNSMHQPIGYTRRNFVSEPQFYRSAHKNVILFNESLNFRWRCVQHIYLGHRLYIMGIDNALCRKE